MSLQKGIVSETNNASTQHLTSVEATSQSVDNIIKMTTLSTTMPLMSMMREECTDFQDVDKNPAVSSCEVNKEPSSNDNAKKKSTTSVGSCGGSKEKNDSTKKKMMTTPSTTRLQPLEDTNSPDIGSFDEERVSTSLEILLDQQPGLLELTTHAKTSQWFQLGVQLGLASVDLRGCNDFTRMYDLWIQKKAEIATRRNLLTALRSIEENNVAWKYESYLRIKTN